MRIKRIIAVLLSALTLFALCACGGGKNDFSVNGSEWELSGVQFDGIEVTGADQLSQYGIEGSIVFNDGTFRLTLLGEAQTGSYTQKSDIVTLTDGTGEAIFCVIDDDTLIVEDPDVGTLYFTFQ